MEKNQGKNDMRANKDEQEDLKEKSNDGVKKKGKIFKIPKGFWRGIWDLFMKIVTIIIVFISITIITQKVTNNKESFLGFRIFRVQTGSMIPKYQVGDVILVKSKDIEKIKIGDDITYLGEEGVVKGVLITHRVIDIEEMDGKRAFHTQGIANNLEDPIVYGEQINGVVQFRMFFLTLICKMLNNKYIFYFCGVLPLTIYVFFRMFKSNRDKYKKRIKND